MSTGKKASASSGYAIVRIESYPPVDYSFKEINEIQEIIGMKERSGKRMCEMKTNKKETGSKSKEKEKTKAKISLTEDLRISKKNIETNDIQQQQQWNVTFGGNNDLSTDSKMEKKLKKENEGGKDDGGLLFIGSAVKLSNNKIKSIRDLPPFLNKRLLFDAIVNLKSLDLSFNKLTSLKEMKVLKIYPNLKILYLHGNQLSKIDDVRYIPKSVVNLTIHGNPLDSYVNYRFHALAVLENLKVLDFSTVTKKEKESAVTYSSIYMKNFIKKRNISDDDDFVDDNSFNSW